MYKLRAITIATWVVCISILMSCKKTEDKEISYEFTKSYCAQVTVGGAVGTQEKCFAVGDRAQGKKVDDSTITIRIAEHTAANDKPANSASYQEFLNVPISHLKQIGS